MLIVVHRIREEMRRRINDGMSIFWSFSSSPCSTHYMLWICNCNLRDLWMSFTSTSISHIVHQIKGIRLLLSIHPQLNRSRVGGWALCPCPNWNSSVACLESMSRALLLLEHLNLHREVEIIIIISHIYQGWRWNPTPPNIYNPTTLSDPGWLTDRRTDWLWTEEKSFRGHTGRGNCWSVDRNCRWKCARVAKLDLTHDTKKSVNEVQLFTVQLRIMLWTVLLLLAAAATAVLCNNNISRVHSSLCW